MIEKITIKFDTKLKPTQYSCKSQFYNLPLWLFHYKTPKQTLDLIVSLGTHSHLILEAVKHLHHIDLYPKTLAHTTNFH